MRKAKKEFFYHFSQKSNFRFKYFLCENDSTVMLYKYHVKSIGECASHDCFFSTFAILKSEFFVFYAIQKNLI